jgi:hypothetical protein
LLAVSLELQRQPHGIRRPGGVHYFPCPSSTES